MKKIFISMALITVLMVTGCTSSKEMEEKQEETTVVYCNDCGNESKEVTKFCSECGVEAKWVAEKAELKEDNDDESTNKEEKEDSKGQCYFCLNYAPKDSLVKIKGLLLCTECNSIDEKACYNGFEDLCEGCTDCKKNDFTVEQAISIAEDYYGIKNHPNDYVDADPEPGYDSKGMYYKMWAKSKEMIEQGGNGIVFSFKAYEDGTIVEY